jgi:hypothetical protein
VSPFWDRGLSTFTFGHETAEERDSGHLVLFDAVTAVAATANSRAFGVKCCVSSPTEADLLVSSIKRHLPGAMLIVVVRRDLVAQYGSLLRARRTGAWHSWRRPERPSDGPVHIRPRLFDRYVLNALDTLGVLRDAQPAYHVGYEDLVADEVAGFRGIFQFLRLPDVPVDWCRGEKVSPPAATYIANYYELRGRLGSLREAHSAGQVPTTTRLVSHAIDYASQCRRAVLRPRL